MTEDGTRCAGEDRSHLLGITGEYRSNEIDATVQLADPSVGEVPRQLAAGQATVHRLSAGHHAMLAPGHPRHPPAHLG